jgi:hypothetical protein
VGSGELPSPAEMQRFTDFQLQVLPPPNPVRSLDNSLTESQQRGRDFYFGPRPSDGIVVPNVVERTFTCNECHVLDPAQGFFGTGRNSSFEGHTQIVKIPHLRNLYAKIGMFGHTKVNFFDLSDSGFTGDQVRGFSFLHDGSTDTLFRFLNAGVFRTQPDTGIGFPQDNGDETRRAVEQFLLAFDSDLAPIVGQQVTLSRANTRTAGPRIDLMIRRAEAPFISKTLGGVVKECDLVANVALAGHVKNFLYNPVEKKFISEDGRLRLSDFALRLLAIIPSQEVTYTCLPPGSGSRIALNP